VDVSITAGSTAQRPLPVENQLDISRQVDISRLVSNAQARMDKSQRLRAAAKAGELDVLRELLDGTDPPGIEATDKDEDTALHYAAHYGQGGVVALLLDRGANINAMNRRDNTPLCLAAKAGRREVVQLLLERGASKWTAADKAEEAGQEEIAAFIGVSGQAPRLKPIKKALQSHA
jgi:ankyrin repeat protein